MIIASVDGEALILTASHVVEEVGPLGVEVGRYNLGWEHTQSARGFPRRIAATVAAQDRASDLAILRVGGQLRLPYVARIGASPAPIAPGTTVESIGFDRGERLVGFWTRVRRVELLDMEHGGGPRPFIVTDHPPQSGRSGGGLFLEDGTLVGTCLARAETAPGRVLGMYSNVGNIRRLLGSSATLESLVARSDPVIRLRPTIAVPPPATASPTSRRRLLSFATRSSAGPRPVSE